MKLISATEYSDYLQASTRFDSVKWELFRLFVKFLKQNLELWMFVPCKLVEGVWVVLEEPKENDLSGSFFDMQTGFHYEKEYQEAKNRCVFTGFEVTIYNVNENSTVDIIGINKLRLFWKDKKEWYKSALNSTIEDLVKYNLELTPTAQQQLGL
jgi:hypothetical protein